MLANSQIWVETVSLTEKKMAIAVKKYANEDIEVL